MFGYNNLYWGWLPCEILITLASPPTPSRLFTFHTVFHLYEDWNFNSGNYLFTTDTK